MSLGMYRQFLILTACIHMVERMMCRVKSMMTGSDTQFWKFIKDNESQGMNRTISPCENMDTQSTVDDVSKGPQVALITFWLLFGCIIITITMG